MASNPSIEHIGIILMVVGLLIVAGALLGIFRATQTGRILRARLIGFGVLLVSLNALRVGIKVHDVGVQGITAFMIVVSAWLMFFAHKIRR